MGTEFRNAINENKVNVNDARELILDGLMTDGGHHKQWFLEEALKKLGVNLKVLRKNLREDDYDWEEGITP